MITFDRVDKWFDDKHVLQQVSFHIQPGEIIGLFGPSGVGKTTVLRLIADLTHPDAGRIHVGKARLSYMFQEPRLLPWNTALENIAAAVRATRQPDAMGVSRHWLNRVELASFADYYPAQLSGGMQQRVALARALAVQPNILLLDEPFSNVDSSCTLRLIDTLQQAARERAITIVYVTHDWAEIQRIATRMIYL